MTIVNWILVLIQYGLQAISLPASMLLTGGDPDIRTDPVWAVTVALIVNMLGWLLITAGLSYLVRRLVVQIDTAYLFPPKRANLEELRQRTRRMMRWSALLTRSQPGPEFRSHPFIQFDRFDGVGGRRRAPWPLRFLRSLPLTIIGMPRTLALTTIGILRSPFLVAILIASWWWGVGEPVLAEIFNFEVVSWSQLAGAITLVSVAAIANIVAVFFMPGWGPKFHGKMAWQRSLYEAGYALLAKVRVEAIATAQGIEGVIDQVADMSFADNLIADVTDGWAVTSPDGRVIEQPRGWPGERKPDILDRLDLGPTTDSLSRIHASYSAIPYEIAAELLRPIEHSCLQESKWGQARVANLPRSLSAAVDLARQQTDAMRVRQRITAVRRAEGDILPQLKQAVPILASQVRSPMRTTFRSTTTLTDRIAQAKTALQRKDLDADSKTNLKALIKQAEAIRTEVDAILADLQDVTQTLVQRQAQTVSELFWLQSQLWQVSRVGARPGRTSLITKLLSR